MAQIRSLVVVVLDAFLGRRVLQSGLQSCIQLLDRLVDVDLIGQVGTDDGVDHGVSLDGSGDSPPHVGGVQSVADSGLRSHLLLLPELLAGAQDAVVVIELILLLVAGVHLDPLPGQVLVLGTSGDGDVPCGQQGQAGLLGGQNIQCPLANDLGLCGVIALLDDTQGRPGLTDSSLAVQECLDGLVNAPCQVGGIGQVLQNTGFDNVGSQNLPSAGLYYSL